MTFIHKNKRVEDPDYRDLISKEPCCCCHPLYYKKPRAFPRYAQGGIAHHYGRTGKGMGQKCDDREVLPICLKHHNEVHAKGKTATQKKYNVDFCKVGKVYRRLYGREM